jgi:hypothetical protein
MLGVQINFFCKVSDCFINKGALSRFHFMQQVSLLFEFDPVDDAAPALQVFKVSQGVLCLQG